MDFRPGEEGVQAALEQAAIGLALTASDGHFLWFNEAFRRFLDYPRDELAALTWQAVTHPDDVEATCEAEARIIAGAVESAQLEKRYVGRGGEVVWAGVSTTLQQDATGRCPHFITAVENIDRHKVTEQLLEARIRLAALAGTRTLHELMVATLDEACTLTASEMGFFHFLMADQNTLSLQAWSTKTMRDLCSAKGDDQHYPISEAGIWADAVRQRRPVVYNDYAALPDRKDLPAGHAEVRRVLSVPILRDGRIVAIIGVGNKATDFGPKDVRVVETLADLAWDLAERKRAEDALAERNALVQRRYEALRVLSEIAALPQGDINRQLSQALTLGAKHLGLSIGILAQIEGDRYTILHHTAPPDAGLADGQVFALGNTYCSITLQAQDVVAISHVGHSDYAGHPCYVAFRLEAYLAMPVRIGGRPFGTVSFSSPTAHPRAFDEGDREFMRLLAGWIGGVLERRQAESDIAAANARLRREANRYEFLLKTASDGIHIMDGDGRLIEASDAFQRMLGYESGEMNGFHIRDWDAHFTDAALTEVLANLTTVPTVFQTKHRRKDGSIIDVEINTRWIDFEGGRYLYASSRDITERNNLEEALRKSEERFRFLFNSGNDSIWLYRIDPLTSTPVGHFIEVNDAACRRLGYSREKMLGLGPADIIDPTSPTVSDKLRLLAQADWAVFEQVHIARNGRRIPVEVNARKITFHGEPFLLAIGRDITMRKALEAELRRSNAELEQFAYVASHDLRQPLRMVTSFLSLVERRLEGRLDHDTREFINFAIGGAKTMDHLILDLLEYSRVGRRGPPMEPVSLADVADEAVQNLGMAISEAGAIITVQPGLPTVLGRRSDLIRLFQNLIGNAVKYRTAGRRPEVTVRCRAGADGVTLSVRDNGIGVPAGEKDRVFQVFQRLHTSDAYEGTGIGLAICRKIVEQHGGRIWVASEVGVGSDFRFTLPAEARADRDAAAAEKGPAPC